jgi:hypothetical protein
MVLPKETTDANLKIRVSLAQSAKNIARIFPTICTSTTITRLELCAGCFVTTATNFGSGAMIIKARCNCLST